MADRLAFHYLPGDSLLHRWDARCKLAALLLITFGLLHTRPLSLALFTILLLWGFRLTHAPLRTLLLDMKSWSLFLLMIFLLQALSLSQGEMRPLPPLPVTVEGVETGALGCWRLGLMLSAGMLFTLVTRPQEMREAILWFLRPFPFLPAQRIALMFSLVMRFLPLLLDEAERVRTASRARLGHLRRNPFARIKVLIVPVFRRSLLRADDFALALVSRGYKEDLPVSLPGIAWLHLSPLLLLLVVVFLGSMPLSQVFRTEWSAFLDFFRYPVEWVTQSQNRL